MTLPDGRVLTCERETIFIYELGSPGTTLLPGRVQFFIDGNPVTREQAEATINGEPYYSFIPLES